MSRQLAVKWISLALPAVLASGCATSALWKEKHFVQFNEPAEQTHLQLFLARERSDVLVQYDEFHERNEKVKRRAYYLNSNEERLLRRAKPHFELNPPIEHLKPIPTIENPGTPLPGELTAITFDSGHGFRLYSQGRELTSHRLPSYEASSGRSKQILLTPLTLVADATIVGGFVALYFWLPAGAPGL